MYFLVNKVNIPASVPRESVKMSAGAGGVTTPIPLTPADFTVETVSAGALYGSEIQSVRASPASEGSGQTSSRPS